MRSLGIDLLRALGAQQPRSARELAAACGARAAEVERCLARLEGTGLVSIANGAAQLTAPFDCLDAGSISAALGRPGAGLAAP